MRLRWGLARTFGCVNIHVAWLLLQHSSNRLALARFGSGCPDGCLYTIVLSHQRPGGPSLYGLRGVSVDDDAAAGCLKNGNSLITTTATPTTKTTYTQATAFTSTTSTLALAGEAACREDHRGDVSEQDRQNYRRSFPETRSD